MNRTYSLKRHKEFRFTYRTGRQVGAGSFVLVTARNRKGKVQVGFSVSKKIGNSVMRNRAKRRLKACFAPLLVQVKPGYNLIFIARAAALTAPF
ncbi:MAG: ribonuclease P protein component, partial [Clostridia bacterium]|nr:ribonuclease P protein component [Clostridia bacterium]